MLRRVVVFLLAMAVLPLIAGLYGALHDQLSFTIAPEYFTRFKYDQFGFEPAWFGGHRPTVAVIGFLAIGEQLTFGQLVGGALILLGMLISELGPLWLNRRRTQKRALSL